MPGQDGRDVPPQTSRSSASIPLPLNYFFGLPANHRHTLYFYAANTSALTLV